MMRKSRNFESNISRATTTLGKKKLTAKEIFCNQQMLLEECLEKSQLLSQGKKEQVSKRETDLTTSYQSDALQKKLLLIADENLEI